VQLFIVHNHFRPGGVRRVIELGAPCLIRAVGPVQEVVLISGEAVPASWLRSFRTVVGPARVGCRIEPALAYVAEQQRPMADIRRALAAFCDTILASQSAASSFVWAHNQGLGRNLILTRELERVCARRNIRLLFHHHDWWFDNRWDRWREMRRSGFPTLRKVAHVVFCTNRGVRHATINNTDATLLKRHLGGLAGWIPNPAGPFRPVCRSARLRARKWLSDLVGQAAPLWVMPCRLLRRKNIAEALLLTRWLCPQACLVTTGGASSADEQAYARALARAGLEHGWPLRLGVLKGAPTEPSVPELIAASDVLLLTSLQEGFGLTYLEAALHNRPLICRALPNIMPDLAHFGLRFRHSYDEIRIPTTLLDWPAEVKRQRRLFAAWRRGLPSECRPLVEPPVALSDRASGAVAFSRLTLTAQLQVLSAPIEQSWNLCWPFNPWLEAWRRAAATSGLSPAHYPLRARRHLGDAACTNNFRRLILNQCGTPNDPAAAARTQQDLIRTRLAAENLYPLTWSPAT